jgi:acyl-CoA thioester hydrolase
VVHNIWYFYFLEEARVEYMRALDILIDDQTFISHTKFFVVHNSCNYLAPAFFDEELTVGSRVESIGSSSLNFEHVIANARTGATIATAKHTLVFVDVDTNRPMPVPDWMREKVYAYEGGPPEPPASS